MSEATQVPKEKLVADFKAVIADAEELLRVTAGEAGEKAKSVRSRIEQKLEAAKADLAEAKAAAIDKAKAAGHAADDYVHENPWRSVGIAAGVGLIVGLLISRR